MARSFAEETVELSNTVGTGAYTIEGPKGNYFPFSASFATGEKPVYVVRNRLNTKSEYNRGGALTIGPPDTLARGVWKSTNGNAAVSWTSDDLPLTIYIPASGEVLEAVVTGWLNAARHALVRAGAFFWTYSDVAVSWRHKLAIGDASQVDVGTFEVTPAAQYFPDARRPYTAIGATNNTVATTDIARRFSFDTAAGARTMTLPTIAAAGVGFHVDVLGLSPANGVTITPDAANAIDYGAAGATLTIPGRIPFSVWSDGTQWRTSYAMPVVPNYIRGLSLSTAGSSATFAIAAGLCADKNNTDMIRLLSSLSKTTAAWAVGTGNGGLDTGAIANSTWYHVHLIKRIDTGVVDALISLSATAPTMPTGYTLSRRLGSTKTNGAAQWTSFQQLGDRFYMAATADFTAGGTSVATLRTLTIPTGVVVRPLLTTYTVGGGNAASAIQVAPAGNATLLYYIGGTYEGQAGGDAVYTAVEGPPTNTSGQIYVAVPAYYAGAILNSHGWIDRRGQDD
ncbi:MAG: hypothetical protein K2Y40_05295 [Reyranella sp.]|nr:hypothetical protein [Reyranella sp.]